VPVVINNSTGIAEDLSEDQIQQALDSNSHSIAMVNPEGQVESFNKSQIPDVLRMGYREPSSDEFDRMIKYSQYSQPKEQLKTVAEHAASMATLGAYPVIAEKAGLMDAEAYKLREEVNPGMAMLGDVAGLIGPTPGAAAIEGAGKIGKAIASKLGASEATALGRLGLTTAKQAAEMAMFQSSDEVVKQFVTEPEKSITDSLIDVGLASVVGGAFGIAGTGLKFAADPFFKIAKETKLAKMITAAKSKAEGATFADDAAEILQKSGIQVPENIKARISSNLSLSKLAKEAVESTTFVGKRARQAEELVKRDATDALLNTLGKTAQDVDKSVSNFELGKSLKDNVLNIAKSLKANIDSAYAPVNKVIKDQALPDIYKEKIASELSQKAIERGYHAYEGVGEMSRINKIINGLPEVKTFDQLAKYLTRTMDSLKQERLFEVKNVINSVFRENQALAEREVLGTIAPNLVEQHAAARTMYVESLNKLKKLGEALKLGKIDDPQQFIKKLLAKGKEEDVLRKLTTEKDAGLLNFVSKEFPELAGLIKKAHIDQLSLQTKEGVLNSGKLLKEIDNMSPELQEFLFGRESLEKIQALGTMLERLGSTKEADQLSKLVEKFFPSGAGAVLSLLQGGALPQLALGIMGGQATKEANAALNLAFTKMMASDVPMSGSAFKAMFEAAKTAYKGAAKTERALESVFKPGGAVIKAEFAPSAKTLGILDKSVAAAQVDPTDLQNISGDLPTYLPEHSGELAAISARAVSYLASLRPDTTKQGPLEKDRVPSEVEISRYNRALALANQPLMILSHIKDGTITPEDIKTVSTIYPAFYQSMQLKLTEKLNDLTSKNVTVPYSTKLGLSLFLGLPLERSISQQNIMFNQAAVTPMPEPKKPITAPSSALKTSKLPDLDSTPQQLRQKQKGK
jgi:hypothetical protein